jgi:hypothetical protein
MDTILSLIIQAICAALVVYVLFRETFPSAAQDLERRLGTSILSRASTRGKS